MQGDFVAVGEGREEGGAVGEGREDGEGFLVGVGGLEERALVLRFWMGGEGRFEGGKGKEGKGIPLIPGPSLEP